MSPEPERVPGLSRGKGRTENPRIYAGVAVALSRLGGPKAVRSLSEARKVGA